MRFTNLGYISLSKSIIVMGAALMTGLFLGIAIGMVTHH